MKFKVGDKVKIVGSNLRDVKVIEAGCRLGDKLGYKLLVGGIKHPCTWWDHELELVESAPFTKADLRDGMVVKLRNGDNCLVLGGILLSDICRRNLDGYKDNLTNNSYNGIDIVSVYSIIYDEVYDFDDIIYNDENLKLIWKREEEPKYKVGDKVKVKDDLSGKFRISILRDMKSLAGKVLTVTSVRPTCVEGIAYNFKETRYGLTEDIIDCLVDYEEMTVSEIEKKLGYKVKIVDGE